MSTRPFRFRHPDSVQEFSQRVEEARPRSAGGPRPQRVARSREPGWFRRACSGHVLQTGTVRAPVDCGSAALRCLLVLPLLILPACKKTERVAGGDDATVIRALVTSEETCLKL